MGRDWDIAELNYNVTGDIVPDVKCNYLAAGTHNGKPYYHNTIKAEYLWWFGDENEWVISPTVGDYTGAGWHKTDPISGNYPPYGTAEGTAIVSEGLH